MSAGVDDGSVEYRMYQVGLEYAKENDYKCKSATCRRPTSCSCVAELVYEVGIVVTVVKGDKQYSKSQRRKQIVNAEAKPFDEVRPVLSELVALQGLITGKEQELGAFLSFFERTLPDTSYDSTEGRIGLRGDAFWDVEPFCRWGMMKLLSVVAAGSFEKFHLVWIDGANSFVAPGERLAEVGGKKAKKSQLTSAGWKEALVSTASKSGKCRALDLPVRSKAGRSRKLTIELFQRKYYKDMCMNAMINNEIVLQYVQFWVERRGKTDKNPPTRELADFMREKKCRLVVPYLKKCAREP